MRHFVYNPVSRQDLQAWMSTLDAASKSKTVLANVYSRIHDPGWLRRIEADIRSEFPSAHIAGCNCAATFNYSRNPEELTQVSLMVMDNTDISSHCIITDKLEKNAGATLADKIKKDATQRIAALILLYSPTLPDMSDFLTDLSEALPGIPVVGGGTGNGNEVNNVVMLLNDNVFSSGIIAVAFYGDNLRTETIHHPGWIPFGETMTVTAANGNILESINNRPAAEVYKHFIGYDKGENFFAHAVEFPFIIKRNGMEIARVPVAVDENNHIHFAADFKRGDLIQFAYGDINSILDHLNFCMSNVNRFQPEGVLAFSCISRLMFLNSHQDLELSPYINMSKSAGFFTAGEVNTMNCGTNLLNATIVSLALSEKPVENKTMISIENLPDIYTTNHRNLERIKRLMFFISRVTEELQKANQELRDISQKDALTDIYNRLALNSRLKHEMMYNKDEDIPLSIIMTDIDHFKKINDTLGHLAGDKVIIKVAKIITRCIRPGDFVARYGGEEFVVVLPGTIEQDALNTAERIRSNIEQESRSEDTPHITCSFGVASNPSGNIQVDPLIALADSALYQAKSSGRNKVCLARPI